MAQLLIGFIVDADEVDDDPNFKVLLKALRHGAAGGNITEKAKDGEALAEAPPPAEATTKTTGKPKANKDFIVFEHSGEQKAGYAKAEDAAKVILFLLDKCTTSAEAKALGASNMQTMARFPKTLAAEIGPKVAAATARLKEKEASTTTATDPAETDFAAQFGAGQSAPGQTTAEPAAASSAGNEEDELAKLFGGGKPAEPEPKVETVDKGTYILEMGHLAAALGPQAAAKFIGELGVANPLHVPEAQWGAAIAKGKAFLASLKS